MRTCSVGPPGSSVSQAAADGSSGTINFTDLALETGDPLSALTAPRHSGTFTWTCWQPFFGLGSPAPSLPSPTVDAQGVPTLWILRNGLPVRRALTGCPIDLLTAEFHLTTSCATSNWWEPLQSLDSEFVVGPGDRLAFALDGWTVTHADVTAANVAAAGNPGPAGPGDCSCSCGANWSLYPVVGNGAVTFSTPEMCDVYVKFTVKAARDDGSTLEAEYAYLIAVP